MVGHHFKICFWTDNWLGTPLIDQVREHSVSEPAAGAPLQAQVGDVYSDSGGWDLPHLFVPHFNLVSPDLNSQNLTLSLDSEVSCAVADTSVRGVGVPVNWEKQIWTTYIPPSCSILARHVLCNKLSTHAALHARSFILTLFCCRGGFATPLFGVSFCVGFV